MRNERQNSLLWLVLKKISDRDEVKSNLIYDFMNYFKRVFFTKLSMFHHTSGVKCGRTSEMYCKGMDAPRVFTSGPLPNLVK